MPPKAKLKATPKVSVRKEINANSTPDEIRFAVQQARACLTAAKRACTRAFNVARDQTKEDPNVEEHKIKGKVLLENADNRYHELEEAYHDLVMLGEDPDGDQELAEDTWTQIQSDYIAWLLQVEADKPIDPTGRPRGTTVGTVATSYTFDMRKHIKEQFSGTDPRVYQSFRLSWDLASAKMAELGYSDALQLMELKKVTKDQANSLIKSLPEEDANLEIALATLDRVYKKPIKVAELAVTDFLLAPKIAATATSVMDAFIAIKTARNTLKGMAMTGEQKGELLFQVICESKLNNALIKSWEELKQKNSDPLHPLGHTTAPEELDEVILGYYDLLLTFETNKKLDSKTTTSSFSEEKEKQKGTSRSWTSRSSSGTIPGGYSGGAQRGKNDSSSSGPKKRCFACTKDGHWITECKILTDKKSGKERSNYLKEKRVQVCRNCLRGAHPTKDCRKSAQCNLCKEPQFHHPFLHFDLVKGTNSVTKKEPKKETFDLVRVGNRLCEIPTVPVDGDHGTVQAAKSPKQDTKPILQSCQAWLLSPGGEKFAATVFLDSGSELTLIRRGLAKEAGLQGKSVPFSMAVAGGGITDQSMEQEVTFQLMSKDRRYVTQKICATTSKQITRDLRPVDVDLSKYKHLQNVKFTEDFPRGERQVDVLVGVQYYTSLLKGEVLKGLPNEPMAIDTKLGYILSGSA